MSYTRFDTYTHTPTHPHTESPQQTSPSGFYILFNVFCFLINRQEWKRLLSALNKLRVQSIFALYTTNCTHRHNERLLIMYSTNSQHLIFFWPKLTTSTASAHTRTQPSASCCPSPPPAPPPWHRLQHRRRSLIPFEMWNYCNVNTQRLSYLRLPAHTIRHSLPPD